MAKTFRSLAIDLRDPPDIGWDKLVVSLAFRDGAGGYITPPTAVVSPASYYPVGSDSEDILTYTILVDEEPQPGVSFERDIDMGAPSELLFSFSADLSPENVDVRVTWVPGY